MAVVNDETEPGLRMHVDLRRVQRLWSEARLRRVAPLTLGALKAGGISVVEAAESGDAFLRQVADESPNPVVRAVALFERAMWRAEGRPVAIEFPVEPGVVITAIRAGQRLPEPDGRSYRVVVSAEYFPQRWRLVSTSHRPKSARHDGDAPRA